MSEPDAITSEEYNATYTGKHAKPNKYLNKKTVVDGHMFDSKKEAHHYGILKMREAAGEIRALQLQPKFTLLVNGVKCGFYKADFSYQDTKTGVVHVIDVKGVKTSTYQLKKRLVKAIYDITVEEV